MKKTVLWVFAAILSICSTSVMTSCNQDDDMEMEYVNKDYLVGPFTRASEGQIEKYENETDAWHGGNSEENVINLSEVTHGIVVHDGDVLTGSINNDNAMIQIQDKATITLRNARIAYRIWESRYESSGLECLGDATIILEGDNYVSGNYIGSPGIYIPECYTLTIKGSGSLEAVGSYDAPGIGSGKKGYSYDFAGNIVLEGGYIIARGMNAPGIGTIDNTCGDITIKSTVGSVKAVNGIKTTGNVFIENGANVIQ